MRLVTWNCNMALHQKLPALAGLRADIAILPECANLEILSSRAPALQYASADWVGRYKHKGLGVFSFGDWTLERHSDYDDTLEFALPMIVSGPARFHLLAIWACHPKRRGPKAEYLGPTRQAVGRYTEFLRAAPSVIAGDFNNNVTWDKPGAAINHSELIIQLGGLGLESAYHTFTGSAPGRELHPTIFWTRNLEKPYHIDYCFVPTRWQSQVRRVRVGPASDWLSISDHAPLTVDIAVETRRPSSPP